MNCDSCGVELTVSITEKSEAEFQANFPNHQKSERACLCTLCYERFWRWAAEHEPELERKV